MASGSWDRAPSSLRSLSGASRDRGRHAACPCPCGACGSSTRTSSPTTTRAASSGGSRAWRAPHVCPSVAGRPRRASTGAVASSLSPGAWGTTRARRGPSSSSTSRGTRTAASSLLSRRAATRRRSASGATASGALYTSAWIGRRRSPASSCSTTPTATRPPRLRSCGCPSRANVAAVAAICCCTIRPAISRRVGPTSLSCNASPHLHRKRFRSVGRPICIYIYIYCLVCCQR
mmetsp:Transcript_88667/g.246763  ORF Transcript_88667/g.246763 Transcript_88667/m.246763 type:complete len:233 (+) Transcript_88667:119-817(+)